MSPTDNFIENVYLALPKLGKTISQVEKEAGVSAGYLSRFKHREGASISLNLAAKIAEVMGVSLDSLIAEPKIECSSCGKSILDVVCFTYKKKRYCCEACVSAALVSEGKIEREWV